MHASRKQVLEEMLGHRESAYLLALRLLGRSSEAEDALQEAYLRVFRYRRTIPRGADGRKWLLKIVANVTKNMRRSEASRRNRERKAAVMRQEQTVDQARSEAGNKGHLREAIREELKRLDASVRAVLSLHYEQGMTYADEVSLRRS